MREEMADGDLLLVLGFKLWPVFGNRVVQGQLSFLYELQDGWSRGDNLGERGYVEYSVGRGGQPLGVQSKDPVGLAEDHLALVTDDNDCSRGLTLPNRLLDYLGNAG